MADKHQPAQQNKPKAQAQKPKQQAKPKPLLPVEVAPVEQAWEAPIPAPTILRQALSNPAQVTPDVLRSLQRTMGNDFTQQFARTSVPEALHRVQTLAHARTAQRETPDDAAATDDLLAEFSTHPLAASMGLVPPVATTVQRAADPLAGQDVQGNVEGEIEKKRGGGQPIPDDTRQHMEGVMGTDFSGVRVHTDSHSDTLNQSLNAKAFTTGADIFFSQGTYSPHSQSGQKLLAHELTHVVQQGASPSQQTHGQRQEEDEEGDKTAQEATKPNEMAETDTDSKGGKEQGKDGDNKSADSAPAAQRKTENAAAPPTPKPTDANAEPRRRVIQPKLRVNHPDDRYEREADAMAEQAIRPPAPPQGSMAPPEKVGPQKEAARLNPGQPVAGNQAGEHAAARSTRSLPPAPNFARQFQRLAQTKPAPEGRKSRVIQPKSRPTQADDQDEQPDMALPAPAHLSAPPAPQKRAVSREPLAASDTVPTASGQPPAALTPMPRLIARKPRTPGVAHFQKHISRSLSKGLGGKPKPGHIGATIQRTTDEAIALAHEHNESQLHGEIQREIAQEQQGGQTLPKANRQELEETFQADLRGVRVHTDANADTLARSLDAKAFTTGADIFFGKGEYNPGSDSGKRLLAHEVTHVMQQGAAARQSHAAPPTPPRTIRPKLRVNHPDDKFEQEADAAADLATRRVAASPPRPLQREDDKATMVTPGGQVTETNQTSGGGDNSPAKAKVSEQTDNGKAKGAAEGASKGAQSDTKKTGDKAKGEAKQGEAAARGDQGKTGGAGNTQTSDTLALPQETLANMQQLPPTVQDASGTEAKLGNAATAALEVPEVTPEAVLPNWSDLAAGTVQLAKKDDEKKKQEEHKKELVGGAKKNNAGKKEAKPKEVKSDKKEPKAADAAAKNADKAADSAGGGEGGGEAKGGGEQKVAEVPPPEPAPQLPPLPEVPHPSEQGGVQPVGSFPSIDAQGVSEEIAWMQSPHVAKISEVISSGLLAEKVQDAQKKPPAPKGEGQAQRKAAAAPGLIQRTPSGLYTPGTPLGYERSDSGLYVPSAEPITAPTLPNTVGGLTTGLNSNFVSRTMGSSLIQRAPFSLTGLAGDISQRAVGTANQQVVQRQAGGGCCG